MKRKREILPSPFEIGQVVRLKSGGTAMTVRRRRDDGTACFVTWFTNEDKMQETWIPNEMLCLGVSQ